MGLTVHYRFRLFGASARVARRLVEKLRRRARTLPFDERDRNGARELAW